MKYTSLAVLLAATASADVKVEFPPDAPLAQVAVDAGGSRVSTTGGALMIDVHAVMTLRNTGPEPLRAVTLLVSAEELTAGGKAFVTVPSLNAKPGETFPVRIDARLLRPRAGLNAPVKITLDGVLYESLAFWGPNKLNSRRSMLVWEMEARRDRKFFQAAMARGTEALQREMMASLAAQDDMPKLNVQVSRGRVTDPSAGVAAQLAALDAAGSPVEILGGQARVAGNEIRLPRVELRNRSSRDVKFVELGWLLRDEIGKQYRGGSLPATVSLAAGERKNIEEPVAIRGPAPVSAISGYVASVEYADGTVWVPGRTARRTVSPEEQRLSEIYRRKGVQALAEELKRFE